jgi:hypothetical protein
MNKSYLIHLIEKKKRKCDKAYQRAVNSECLHEKAHYTEVLETNLKELDQIIEIIENELPQVILSQSSQPQ